MNTIKFRAWNPKRKVMVYDPIVKIDSVNTIFKVSVFKFMQYTGLKDKNEKEIYEGDIVKMQQIQGYGEIIGAIHIGAEPDRPYDCRVWVDTSHTEDAKKHGVGGKWVFIHDNPEVIGNIYENPELLK